MRMCNGSLFMQFLECLWFIALHTNYSIPLVGCDPDHHIFASYGPDKLVLDSLYLNIAKQILIIVILTLSNPHPICSDNGGEIHSRKGHGCCLGQESCHWYPPILNGQQLVFTCVCVYVCVMYMHVHVYIHVSLCDYICVCVQVLCTCMYHVYVYCVHA